MSDMQTKPEALTQKVNELLNEEKWTRATLANYTIHNFKELDALLDEIFAAEGQEAVKLACQEHLHHAKNSIIGLYISGVIAMSQQIVDDANLVMLINIFTDNHKWSIVEYLCHRILQFGENKYALKTLAECYHNGNETSKLPDIWERLIRIDYEEADIVKLLAEKKEQEEQLEEAVDYYKKALHRFINKKLFNNVREIWHKLIVYCPEETEFFYHAEKKVAKTISADRAVQLIEDLYPHFKKTEKWDTAIEILKRILEYDSKSPWARKEIIECFRKKYAEHSQLEEYIRLSNLTASWRNIHDAVADFEKHISFDAGNFVFHRSWGVGRINRIKGDEIVIDFAAKRGHAMKLKMAVGALTILSRQHIWVLKSVMKKEKLHEKVKADILWALKTVIKSLDNAADMKRIKNELVPSVLSPGEWPAWSAAARKILKTDTNFGNLPDKLETFVVRDQPISYVEKAFNKFKSEKNFFARVETIQEYIFTNEAGPDTEYFGEMFDYFVSFIKTTATGVNEYTVASALLVRKIVQRHPFLGSGLVIDFRDLYSRMQSVDEIFSRLDNNELRKDFLVQLKANVRDWPAHYAALFPNCLYRPMLDELLSSDHDDLVLDLFRRILDNYREYREPFIWLTRYYWDEGWYTRLDLRYEKILIYLIHILDITFREIENRKDAQNNRKLNKQVQSFLFKETKLLEFVKRADEESLVRIYSLVEDVKDLDPSIKIELRHFILERFPDFKFHGGPEKEIVSNRGFFASPSGYETKQKQLQHILEVEVPENSKEIGHAISLGDLRENAEYKAAKEKQDMLNATAAKLKDELDRAQIVSRNDVEASRISFGTVVHLRNMETGGPERFVILGPWESDPNKGVISYLSPFGNELYGHERGKRLTFTINDRSYDYIVDSIEPAEF